MCQIRLCALHEKTHGSGSVTPCEGRWLCQCVRLEPLSHQSQVRVGHVVDRLRAHAVRQGALGWDVHVMWTYGFTHVPQYVLPALKYIAAL